MVRVPSFMGLDCFQSSEVGAFEISSQFNLHVGTTFLADFTTVSFTLEHLDHGHKAFSMLSIGGTNDKAGVAWNSTTLREKVAPAFVHIISLCCSQIQFQFLHVSCNFRFWMFGHLTWWVQFFFWMAWIHDVLFSAKFCDLVQTLETLTTLPT